MSALAADALAGSAVAHAQEGTAADMADALRRFGAKLVDDDAPADLVVVAVEGATPSLDAAAGGALAAALTAAFGAARDAFLRLRPGGSLLFVLADASAENADASAENADIDPARAALGSLTRTLALEWAPERRVNALVCADPNDAIEAAALIAWPASRSLTGAVLDTRSGV